MQDALYPLAHGKCAFCEGVLGVTTYLEIEHYLAKTLFPEQVFEWTNLLPACRLCNGSKGDQDHQNALLKPDEEDPEPYFWVHPDTGKLEPDPRLDEAARRRAEETIRICNLQRSDLCSQRADMLKRVGRWLGQVSGRRRLSGSLKEEWDYLSNPKTQFKLVVRHTLEMRGQPDLAQIDRQRFEAPPE